MAVSSPETLVGIMEVGFNGSAQADMNVNTAIRIIAISFFILRLLLFCSKERYRRNVRFQTAPCKEYAECEQVPGELAKKGTLEMCALTWSSAGNTKTIRCLPHQLPKRPFCAMHREKDHV